MKRFFAIALCLVVTGSLGAAPEQPRRTATKPATSIIVTAIRLLEWRLGVVPNSDALTPPIPKPTAKPTTCCK